MNIKDIIEFVKLLFDLIQGLAWPIVFFLIFFRFQAEFKALINRITDFSAAGVSLTAQDKQKIDSFREKEIKLLAKKASEKESAIEELLKIQSETRKGKDYYEIMFHFEKTYRLIFGSQLNILLLMRDSSIPIRKALLQSIHFRSVLARSYPFNNFIGFLLDSYLILRNTPDDTFILSPLGKLFLNYIDKNKLSLNKPL